MAEQEKTSKPQPEEEDRSEFKLFKQIEHTIEGTFDFVVRFAKTSLALCVRPSAVVASLREPRETVLSRPFTYLTVSVFLSGVMLRSVVGDMFYLVFARGAERPQSITEELGGVTLTGIGMLQTVLPTLIFVLLLGAIFAAIMQRRFGKSNGLQVVCYATGLQFILVAIVSAGGVAYEAREVYFAPFDVFAGVLVWIFVAYILIGPACVFYTFTRNDEPSTSGILWHQRLRKALGFAFALALSTTLLYGGSIGAVSPLIWRMMTGEPVRLRVVETSLTPNGKLAATLTIENKGFGPRILRRTGATSAVKLWHFKSEDSDNESWEVELDEVDLNVESWDGGESPVLVLAPSTIRWLQVSAELGSTVSAKAISTSEVYGRLSIVLPTTSFYPISDTFNVGEIKIGP